MASSRPEVQRKILSQNQNNKQKSVWAENFTHNLQIFRPPPSDDLMERLDHAAQEGPPAGSGSY